MVHIFYMVGQSESLAYFVSLDEYIRYAKGELSLPEKSVMIAFDDGYRSFYTKVYPLLKKYRVPGMLAIVSSWTNGEEKPNDVRDLASWQELKEMEASGLVAVVSHTHAMHKQQAINSQGSRNGVVGSHLYFQGRYESDEEYETRLACWFPCFFWGGLAVLQLDPLPGKRPPQGIPQAILRGSGQPIRYFGYRHGLSARCTQGGRGAVPR